MESLEFYCPYCERMTTFQLADDENENDLDPDYVCNNCQLALPLSELEQQ